MPKEASKLARLRTFMLERGLQVMWLRRADNIAWLTDGARSLIDLSGDAVLELVVTPDAAVARTSEVEAARLAAEEGMASWTFETHRWDSVPAPVPATPHTGVDWPLLGATSVQEALCGLRLPLSDLEVARYRALGQATCAAVLAACRALPRGLREHDVAAAVAAAIYGVGAVPRVLLVAGEARLASVRHPLPTQAAVGRRAMVVVCAQAHGLVVSFTRLLTWGAPDAAWLATCDQAARIDAAALAATQPGTPLCQVVQAMLTAYAKEGLPDSWRGLHLGGPCSYAPRDHFATQASTQPIVAGGTYAWNPSLPGAKSEDTVLVTTQGLEVLTAGAWPTSAVQAPNGAPFARPRPLILDA